MYIPSALNEARSEPRWQAEWTPRHRLSGSLPSPARHAPPRGGAQNDSLDPAGPASPTISGPEVVPSSTCHRPRSALGSFNRCATIETDPHTAKVAQWPAGSLPDLGCHAPPTGPTRLETDVLMGEPAVAYGPTNPDRVPHAAVG
jgi:hypothetical protein